MSHAALPRWRAAAAIGLVAGLFLAPPPACADDTVTDIVVTNCATADELLAALAGGSNSVRVTFAGDNANGMVLSKTIVITTNTVVDGAGHTIVLSGNNAVRLFTVNSNAKLELYNLKLIRGKGVNGGAVLNRGTVVASNCAFYGNNAVGGNGAAGADGSDDDIQGGDGTSGGNGAAAMGGAIYNERTLWLQQCTFQTNSATGGNGGKGGNGGNGEWGGGQGGDGGNGALGWGGAIYNAWWVHMTNCTFTQNSATGGNGGSAGTGGTGAVAGYPGDGGTGAAGSGAALYNQASAVVTHSTFVDNAGQGGNSAAAGVQDSGVGYTGATGGHSKGGGICNPGTCDIVNCTFSANKAAGGSGGTGGSGDFAAGDGGNGGNGAGGHLFNSGTVNVTNATFAAGAVVGGTNGVAGTGPTTGSDGHLGARQGGNLANVSGACRLKNTIVAASASGANGYGTMTDLGHNLSSDASLSLTGTGSRNSTDPKLGSLADNGGPTRTLALLAGSPAIDKADPAVCLGCDQRGVIRPADRGDIGAYEYGAQPTITTQPASQTVTNGTTATLTVSVNGEQPMSYQWQFNSNSISGATSNTFTIAKMQATNVGKYSVIITNSFGSTNSAEVTLSMVTQPMITKQPPTNQTVVLGTNVAFVVEVSGDAPLGYQWQFNGTSLSDGTNRNYSITDVQTNHEGDYQVIVTNFCGSVTSITSTLYVLVPPAITEPPASLTVTQGATATFKVEATGSTPLTSLTYQWRLNSNNIPGATLSLYTINKAATNHAGRYDVIVSNGAGSVTSSPANLTLLTPPYIVQPPTAQSVSVGSNATFSVTAMGTEPLVYQWRFNSNIIDGATSTNCLISNAQLTNAGAYDVVVTNLYGAVTSAPARLTVTLPVPVILQQPASLSVLVGSSAGFNVRASGAEPLSYQWRFNSNNISGAVATNYSISSAQHTNAGPYDVVVANQHGAVTSLVAALTVTGAPPAITTQPASQTVGLRAEVFFTAAATGTAPLSYQWRFNSNNIPDATNTTFRISEAQTDSAGSYDVVVTNLYGKATSAKAILTVIEGPRITLQPVSQEVALGSTVTFRTAAAGTPPLTYQWRLNGVNLPGGGLTTYTISGVKTNQAGTYDVIVSNGAGAATSDPATLKVLPVPAPRLTATLVNSNLNITLPSAAGLSYTLEYNTTLGPTNWEALLPARTGMDGTLTFTNTLTPASSVRYYRVRVQSQ